jgi:nucleotide-binding universal stress UspA family protein
MCAVAVDDRDRRVFAHAVALAARNNAQLLVIHAASPEVAFNHGATERVDLLRTLRSMAEAAGVDVRVTVQRGPVAEIILLHARARHADLIVLGTDRKESRRGLSRWIAERVLRDAPCPTLVVPHTSEDPAVIDNILCAVDFLPASQAAIDQALRLASTGGRHLTLLHAIDGRDQRHWLQHGWPSTHDPYREERAVHDKLRFLVPPGQRDIVSTEVAVGEPADEILRTAAAVGASLIVIGARERTRIGSRLFGKIGTLLRDARCPVLAVPVSKAVHDGADPELKTAA